MGVQGLWSLMDEYKEKVKLTDCCRKTLAVDLSSWIVHCSSSQASKNVQKSMICHR